MRLLPEERLEIIQMVARGEIGVDRTLREPGIHKSTSYKWYNPYLEEGEAGFYPPPCFPQEAVEQHPGAGKEYGGGNCLRPSRTFQPRAGV